MSPVGHFQASMTDTEEKRRRPWSFHLRIKAGEMVTNPKRVKPKPVYLHDHRARDEVDDYLDGLRE